MLSSSLAWQLFMGCVSLAETTVFVLGAVLLAAYVAMFWQTRRAPGGGSR